MSPSGVVSVRGILIAWLFACSLATAQAQGTPLGLSWADTPDARFVFIDSLGFLTKHSVQTFTNSLAWQKQRFGWTPSERITLLLKDGADYGNAHAQVAPHTRLIFDVAPESHAFEANTGSEQFYTTMNHELVHLATGDVASSQDRAWRSFFGGKVTPAAENPETMLYNYLTVPRFVAPRWLLEGEAVFMETWMNGGIGRAQGGYDEMVFRAMVRDHAQFHDPLSLVSRGVLDDFQVGANAYLYGTRFLTWLAYAYSPDQVAAWIRRDEGSKRYYSDQFEQVFGLPLDDAWKKWIAFEREFQQRNLQEVRRFPITQHKALVDRAVGSMSRVYLDEKRGVLYAGFRIPGVVDYIGGLNLADGTMTHLADIKRAMLYRVTSFAFDPSTGTAFYTNNNLTHRDLMAVDVRTGRETLLLEGERIGEIVLDPKDKSLLGVRHSRGLASLVRIPYPYTDWEKVYDFPYGIIPTDLDISADGRLLSASVGELSGKQFVRVWELQKVLAGDLTPIDEFQFGQSFPESFVFSKDGKYLYGSSYYTGVSNIFRCELATGDIEAVSNAEVGYFRPIPLDDGRLLALTYTGQGFVPVTFDPQPLKDVSAIKFLGAETVAKHPELKGWQVPPPSKVDADKLITATGAFEPLKDVKLDDAYPVLQGYKDSVGLGYHFNFADPLGFAKAGLTVAVTPDRKLPGDEWTHVELKGEYLNWHALFSHNRSDFYDLFGPTKRARRGNVYGVGYEDSLIYDPPRLLNVKYDVKLRTGMDTLPEAQNVASPFTRLLEGEASLKYTDVRKSLGAVDDEKGTTWALTADATRVQGRTIPQAVGEGALGFQFGQSHSSLWLRGAAGAVQGDRLNPVANFYFGGFGNNYVDFREVKRFREYGSMPGFEIDEIGAQRFAKVTGELNLPPILFGSMGVPVFYANWLRSTVFASALLADPGGPAPRERYTSVGGQLDLHFSVLHWNELMLSVGYAQGFRGGRRRGSEWMLSLKVM
jgi:hypothetical protein